MLKRYFAFINPISIPIIIASQVQLCSGFILFASSKRLLPFEPRIILPIYQTRAADILRVRVDDVNLIIFLIFVL